MACCTGDGGGQHRLAENDDGEQPVALADVLRMPRGHRPAPFSPEGDHHLQDHKGQEGHGPGGVGQPEAADPTELQDGDAYGVSPADLSVVVIRMGGP